MVTHPADSIASERPGPAAQESSGAVVWWHALWGLAVLGAGAGLYAGFGGASREVFYALACGIAPCLIALVLQSVPRAPARAILLVVWASFGAAACLLTGGVTGPLAPWILAPVAAAAVLGRSNLLAQAAALSLMAGCVAALAQLAGLTGPRPPQGMD